MTGPRRRRRGPTPAPRKITVRLSEDEHHAVREAAATRPGRGVSMARFVAEAALAAANNEPPQPPSRGSPSRLVLAEIVDAVSAVNRVGNNLNQIAREKNATGHRPANAQQEVQRALNALDQLAQVAEQAAKRQRD